MNLLLALPLLIPLTTAATSFLAWRSPVVQRWLGLIGAVFLLATSLALLAAVRRGGVQAVQLGNWPAPFGITLVADLFSAIMVVLGAIMAVAVMAYSVVTIDPTRERFGYYPLLSILMMGVSGAFLTGDIFNLFVWFEVMLISSFVLLALGGERPQMEGAFKYVTLNLVSSTLFLTAVGILYGVAGTLNMADLSVKLEAATSPGVITTVAMLFLVAFGIKAAVFPLFFWLPASYHTPPIAVSAIFAGLLTKVGVYALIRVFTLLFVQDVPFTHTIILVISGLTMVTGVLGAVSHNEFRRILSFHIISQIGYMILGLGLYTPLALAGSIFYIIHHIIVKTNLFLVSGVVYRLRGSYELKELGGIYKAYPALGVLFLIPAFSLAGMPPLSGFFAKLILVQAGLRGQDYWIVAVALAVGLMTLLSMTKIWAEVFWKEPAYATGSTTHSSPNMLSPSYAMMLGPIVGLATLTVLIGVGAGAIFNLSSDAATQLFDNTQYVAAVLGVQP